LQQTILEMVQAQQKFQQETLAMLAQVKAAPVSQLPFATSAPTTSAKPILSPADREREEIQDAFARNEVEEATLKVV
jgi:pectin methylesterase-like acyl-CoA thioesterase